MVRRSLFALLVVLIQPLEPSRLDAQSFVSGTVRDADGRALPGVSVRATALTAVRNTVTDGRGRFTFADLPEAAYILTFTLPGFRQITRSIVLPDAAAAPIDIVMSIALPETITFAPPVPRPNSNLQQPPAPLCSMRVIPVNPAIDPKMLKPTDKSRNYTIVTVRPACEPSHPAQGR